VRYFIFSSTAAVYGNPQRVPVREDDPTVPTSPYGSSKLMSEIMLRDAGTAHGLRHVILRYFNVAGADPLGRTGQSTRAATHLTNLYGPGDNYHAEDSHVLPALIRRVYEAERKEASNVTVWGTAHAARQSFGGWRCRCHRDRRAA
jgi:nucleoside-diphosphate-sugar epimerase